MCFPLSPRAPGSRDPEWRVVFWLIIVVAIMITLLVFFIIFSSAIGCATFAECADKTGIGEMFSVMPWLAPLCVVFLIIGVGMAILGVMFWQGMLNGRYSGPYARNRPPPR